MSRQPKFSHLVCGTDGVRAAFTSHAATRFWWRLILMLHGKPVAVSLSPWERTERVADGFRFYAGLYRLLAFVFAGLAIAFSALGRLDTDTSYTYWTGANILAALYLWSASGLGYAGARSYRLGKSDGIICLLGFMVMIVAFLSWLTGFLSLEVSQSATIAPIPNLTASALLFLFGIGSYGIEIVYIVTLNQGRDSSEKI